jgi:4-amino-4-deoxy-L-arabinose transferase-like glycosyltransferase
MHSVVLGTEALFTALVAAALLCIIYHLKRRFRRKYILLAGICLGLAAITRYMLFMLPIFILAVYLFINGIDLRKKIVNVALMYVFMLICIMPVTLVNYINTHEFHLVEKSGDRMDIVWYNSYLGREDMCPSNLIFVEAGFDPFKKPAEAALFVLKHPVKFTGLCYRVWSKRLRNFLFWPNFGFSDPLILVNPSRMPNEFGSTMEFYFFIVYIIGSFVLLQGLPADRARLVLLVPILYFIFIHAILFMFSTVRYRVPVIPYLSIIFAVGLNRIFSFVRREQPRTTSETAVQHNRYRGL